MGNILAQIKVDMATPKTAQGMCYPLSRVRVWAIEPHKLAMWCWFSILKGHTRYKQVGEGLVLCISQNKLAGPNGLRPRKLEYGAVWGELYAKNKRERQKENQVECNFLAQIKVDIANWILFFACDIVFVRREWKVSRKSYGCGKRKEDRGKRTEERGKRKEERGKRKEERGKRKEERVITKKNKK
jgi:hypothetical protein